jgi:putative hydrolase of the HAD superfamily
MGFFGHGCTLSVSKVPNVELSGLTIQAVFFDMGGTIETFWYTRELRLNATPGLQQLLLDAGIKLGLQNEQLFNVVSAGLKRYHELRVESLDEYPARHVWSEYVLSGYTFDPTKLASIAEELMLYVETHYYHREMRPEMPAVLNAIQQMGLKIGLISNVCSRGQVPTNLTKYNIRHYFDPIVLSCEYGRRKPDPSIFHYAARLANVPTSESVYVGDRVSRDIIGAHKAGYRLAIQIRHDFDHGEEDKGTHPDAVIGQMTELLDILRIELDQSASGTTTVTAPPHPIRALLFDAGDILYFRPHRDHKLAAYLNELALSTEDAHAEEKKSIIDQAYQGQINQDQYREAILRMYGITQPEQIERGKQILAEDDNNVHFFEGVQKTLIALKDKGYLLGIVTDTAMPLHVKLSWFERGGFGHVWDAITSSKELGIRKPNPQIYQAALQQLGLQPSQAVFVGHSALELDGARAVGIKTVAFNYEEGAIADYYIVHFADILKLPIVNQMEAKQW